VGLTLRHSFFIVFREHALAAWSSSHMLDGLLPRTRASTVTQDTDACTAASGFQSATLMAVRLF